MLTPNRPSIFDRDPDMPPAAKWALVVAVVIVIIWAVWVLLNSPT